MQSDIKELLAFIFQPEDTFPEVALDLLHAYVEAEAEGKQAAVLYPEVKSALDKHHSFEELYQDAKRSLLRERRGVLQRAPVRPRFDFSYLRRSKREQNKRFDEALPKGHALWQVVERAGKQVTQLFTELHIVLGRQVALFDNLPAPLVSEWKALPLATRTDDEYGRVPLLSLPSHEHDMSLRLTVMPPKGEEPNATLTVEVTEISSGQPKARCRVTIRDRQYRMLESYMTGAEGRVDFVHISPGNYVLDVKHRGRVLQLPIAISWQAS